MDMVQAFGELLAEAYSSAGGKGGTLTRLYRAGYAVPEGFVILPAAFGVIRRRVRDSPEYAHG